MRLAAGVTMDTQPYSSTAEGSLPASNSGSLASSVLRNIFGRNGSAQAGERQESPEITTAIQNSLPSNLVRDVLSRLDARKERAAVELGIGVSEVESLPFDLSTLESEGIFMNIDCRGLVRSSGSLSGRRWASGCRRTPPFASVRRGPDCCPTFIGTS